MRKFATAGFVVMTPQRSSIAIVDDDVSFREALAGLIQSVGYRAETFESGPAFLAAALPPSFACLIADIHMPEMTGFELCELLAARGYGLPVIYVTSAGDRRTEARARAMGAVGFLTKPFDDDALIALLRRAVSSAR